MITTNLLSHTTKDLSVMIDLIEEKQQDIEKEIKLLEAVIVLDDDLSEINENRIRREIGFKKQKLESLYAWRMIFLDAWQQACANRTVLK